MRGFGSIARRGAAWRARIVIAGRRVERSFPTRALATEWLREMRARKVEVEGGLRRRITDSRVTYGEAAEALLAEWEAGVGRRWRRSTVVRYRSHLRAVLEDWRDVRIAETTPAMVDAWVRRQRGVAPNTLRNRLVVLSQMGKLAARRGWIEAPPVIDRRPRPVQRDVIDAISEADLDRLLAAARAREDLRAEAILLLAADAGLRRSEISRLRGEDVRLDGDQPAIHVAARDAEDRPKSGRGRWVPILTERLRQVLRRLFPAPGRPLLPGCRSPEGVGHAVSEVWGEVLGGGPRLHRLRHRFGTRLVEAGVPTARVQRWMGHASITTTERYLAAVAAEPTGREADALEGPKWGRAGAAEIACPERGPRSHGGPGT